MRKPRLNTHLMECEEVCADHMLKRYGLLLFRDGGAEEISSEAEISSSPVSESTPTND